MPVKERGRFDRRAFICCAVYAFHDCSPVHHIFFICGPEVEELRIGVFLVGLQLGHEPLSCAA